MQVITLNEDSFDKHAERLAKWVEELPDSRFNALVAVRRGGSLVCDAFCRHFNGSYGARYDVTRQRPSTRRKGKAVSALLKCLPLPILDIMRMAESFLLSIRRRSDTTPSMAEIEMPLGLRKILKEEKFPKILIIDDAIDSGDTLFDIVATLKKTNPNAVIRIAVLTETTRNPRIRADVALYRNRTLIRFPWSNDYKNQ